MHVVLVVATDITFYFYFLNVCNFICIFLIVRQQHEQQKKKKKKRKKEEKKEEECTMLRNKVMEHLHWWLRKLTVQLPVSLSVCFCFYISICLPASCVSACLSAGVSLSLSLYL